MTDMTPAQAEALAKLLLTVRPDWTLHYTRDAVWAMRTISTDLERVTRVAVRGALSPRIAKPDVLPMRGEHWKAQADDQPEPPRAGGRCPDCGGLHGTGPHDPHEPTRSARTPEHIAALRVELAQARTRLCPHGVPRHSCADHREQPAQQPTEETA